MKLQVAKKEHRCTDCGRRIPIGAKYWSGFPDDRREHTNCLDFEAEPALHPGFNKNRSLKLGA